MAITIKAKEAWERWKHDWLSFERRDPQVDSGKVGITFVDLLFAAVVGLLLLPLEHWYQIRLAGWFQLSTATLLILTSWIGYHNSESRPSWRIHFVNWPLLIFALDIGMVFIYGFAVWGAALNSSSGDSSPQVLPLSIAVCASFFLYVVWDWTNRKISSDLRYQEAWRVALGDGRITEPLRDRPVRRRSTRRFFVFTLVLTGWAAWIDQAHSYDSNRSVVAFDLATVSILVLYRWSKEQVAGPVTVLVGLPPVAGQASGGTPPADG